MASPNLMLDNLVETAHHILAGEEFSLKEKQEATAFIMAYNAFKNYVEGENHQ